MSDRKGVSETDILCAIQNGMDVSLDWPATFADLISRGLVCRVVSYQLTAEGHTELGRRMAGSGVREAELNRQRSED